MKYVYSPETYIKLAKLDFLQPYYQKEQDEITDEIALGGLYEIKSENKGYCELMPGNFKIIKKDLIPISDIKENFAVGDKVLYSPICTKMEKKYLMIDKRFIIGNTYKIARVINHFYVLLINKNGEISNPIRFFDIQILDSSTLPTQIIL